MDKTLEIAYKNAAEARKTNKITIINEDKIRESILVLAKDANSYTEEELKVEVTDIIKLFSGEKKRINLSKEIKLIIDNKNDIETPNKLIDLFNRYYGQSHEEYKIIVEDSLNTKIKLLANIEELYNELFSQYQDQKIEIEKLKLKIKMNSILMENA